MPVDISPMWIPVALFLGGVLSPILGWARAYLDTKKVAAATMSGLPAEHFDWKRVLASGIIAAVAALIFMGQYSQALFVGWPDLELAFIAGFGSDKIVKNAIGI